jgi:hypothetical protein
VVAYESWIDRQIREAIERGEFDNLRGAGQPLPGINGREDPDWWVKGLIEREKIKPALPTSLALRKEVEDLPAALVDVHNERDARDLIEDLNARIRDSRVRHVDGPAMIVKTVDVDAALDQWRRRRET